MRCDNAHSHFGNLNLPRPFSTGHSVVPFDRLQDSNLELELSQIVVVEFKPVAAVL